MSSTPSSPVPMAVRANLIHWPVILASTSFSLTLIVCVVAWIITHPNKAVVASEAPNRIVQAVPLPSPSLKVPAAITELPAPQPISIPETLPVVYQAKPLSRLARRIPLMMEASPPLPPPASEQFAEVQAVPQRVGETYGTQVLFLNNQEAAAEQAKRLHKLVFVMHISGNFEDACFT